MANIKTRTTVNKPHQRVLPVQERSRLKLNTILDTAAKLLVEQGIEATTMQAIADTSAVSLPSIYHYFENRLAVFAALAERTMLSVDTNLARQLSDFAGSTEQSSRHLLQALFSLYQQSAGYVPLLMVLRAEPSLQELVRESNRRIASVLSEVLVLRTTLPRQRAQRIGWMLSESCEQILQAALLAKRKEGKELLEELIEMVDALILYYSAKNAIQV